MFSSHRYQVVLCISGLIWRAPDRTASTACCAMWSQFTYLGREGGREGGREEIRQASGAEKNRRPQCGEKRAQKDQNPADDPMNTEGGREGGTTAGSGRAR
jgi:hypothetical protein